MVIGKGNMADYVTKNYPIFHHRTMVPRYLKATTQDIENSKDRKTGTGRGCSVTNNPRETQKPDNPLKGIRNPIPQNLDSPLKVIQNLVPNGIRGQWSRGLTVPN